MAVTTWTAGQVLAAQDLNDTFASKLDEAGGKILQIVRATDSTDRTTTSAGFVDVTGMSVTITPQKSDSAVIIIASFNAIAVGSNAYGRFAVTDSSNNAISGAEVAQLGGSGGDEAPLQLIAYATPATTSAVTYKLRFLKAAGTSIDIKNNTRTTGQMYAIEVSA